jgi:hypothetical protein
VIYIAPKITLQKERDSVEAMGKVRKRPLAVKGTSLFKGVDDSPVVSEKTKFSEMMLYSIGIVLQE